MNSRLYKCTVSHSRIRPKSHRFKYKIFFFCIDLDELDTLDKKLWFFSDERRNIYSLRTEDHFDEGGDSIKENVENFVRKCDIDQAIHRIELITHLRTFGHIFNPVSFFYIYDNDDRCTHCIAEVTNTFKEQKLYLIENQSKSEQTFKKSILKNFYISPFSDLDTFMDFSIKSPGNELQIVINEHDKDGTYFFSSVSGQKAPLNNRQLIKSILRFPFVTIGVIVGIHWQALKLFLKKVPHNRKAENPELQTNVRPYIPKVQD